MKEVTFMSCKKKGYVSIWIGLEKPEMSDVDVLKDLCGVDADDIDPQESVLEDRGEMTPIGDILSSFPHSKSFLDNALELAARLNLKEARWATVQYDYQYDPGTLRRPAAADPVFLGVFPYKK